MIDTVLHRMLEAFRREVQPMVNIPGSLAMLEESLRLYERCISRP